MGDGRYFGAELKTTQGAAHIRGHGKKGSAFTSPLHMALLLAGPSSSRAEDPELAGAAHQAA